MFAIFGLGGQEILLLGCCFGVPLIIVVVVLIAQRGRKPRDRDDDDDF